MVSAGLWGRVINTCADHLEPEAWSVVLGTVEHRAATVAGADPNTLSFVVDPVGRSATVTRLLPLDAPEQEVQAWDTAPKSRSRDTAHHEAVAAAQRLADACPELTAFEIITVTASGKRYKIADLEPGAKRMSRDVLKDRVSVRRAVGFQAALRRATAATSWTEIVREQINISKRLVTLAEQAVARLSAYDNQLRRRQWSEDLARVTAHAAALAARPAITAVDPAISHAQADDADRAEDAASKALDAVANALSGVVESAKPLTAAITIRDATAGLVSASAQSNPTLTHLGSPIPNELVLALQRLANTLAVLDRDPSAARRIRARDLQGSATGLVASAVEVGLPRFDRQGR